jgi:uncharacterized protein YjiS (DUF1127 family)
MIGSMRFAHDCPDAEPGGRAPDHPYIALHHGSPERRQSGPARVLKRKIAMIRTLSAKLHAWRRFRESVRELSRLSDRELNDLGIGRSDIVDVVRQGSVVHN